MRLDEEKLEALRSWGERLRQSESEESNAVGRAILMLTEEIDQLHIELWHVRLRESRAAATPEAGEEPVSSTLQDRLHGVLGRDSDPDAQSERPEGTDSAAESPPSPQSWIDGLRRRK